jgi:hypothetical protein
VIVEASQPQNGEPQVPSDAGVASSPNGDAAPSQLDPGDPIDLFVADLLEEERLARQGISVIPGLSPRFVSIRRNT